MAWASTLTSGAKALYKTASDAYAASTFNRDAYNEAHREHVNYRNDDIDCNADFDPAEEWTAVTKVERDPFKEPKEEYLVQRHAAKFKQLRFKISQKAAEAASEAAGVSLDYTQWALKYVALEMAHDVGWISGCKTATDAVRAVQARFPILEDIKLAYQSGTSAARRRSSAADSRYRGGSFGENRYASRSYEPQPGVTHPNHVRVPSNLDGIPIITDNRIRANLATHRGKPVWDAETRAELEVVLEPIVRSATVPRKDPRTVPSHIDQPGQPNAFDDVNLDSEDELDGYAADEDESDDPKDIKKSLFLGNQVYNSDPIIGSRDSEESKASAANGR